ncbi:MAG: protein kinase, partial [Chloroflexi bacterium]|nr:protein kinase [Chloroflexota bacterium]
MTETNRIRCPKCNYPNMPDAERCAVCGLPLTQRCPTCGQHRPWYVEHCPKCHREAQGEELFAQLFRQPPPRRLRDRYAIRRELARGVATAVFLAEDEQRGGARVVVKEFSDQSLLAADDRRMAVEAFGQTVACWAGLRHPALPQILEVFSRQRQHYVVMEAVAGRSLARMIEDPAQLMTESMAVNWIVQLCDLLTFLHGQTPPLVFANLKPSHLLVEASGRLRAVGWNLDALLQPWRGMDPRFAGTPGYEAPEQRQGKAEPASDVFAAGRLLYSLLTRQTLRAGQRLRALRQVNPSISPKLEQAVTEAMRTDLRTRTATAEAFRRALLDVQGEAAQAQDAPPEALETYRLSGAEQARDLPDLVRLSQDHWEPIRNQFFAGEVSRWLRAQAEQLRRSLQAAQADRLALLADSADRAREESGLGSTGQQDVAFARWLQATGHVPGKPVLQTSTRLLKLGVVPADRKLKASFRVQNGGSAYLFGAVTSEAPWLRPIDREFGCPPGQAATLAVMIDGSRLPPKGEQNPQALLLESNGGRAWVGAQAAPPAGQLTVTPSTVDFGRLAGDKEATIGLRVAN